MSIALLIAYICGYIYLWKIAFVWVLNDTTYWNGKYRKPEPIDVMLSALLATLVSFIWPVFLIPYLLYQWIKPGLNYYIDKNWDKK